MQACNTMQCMSTRNRTLRLDDENYEWLNSLPGKSLNDALTALRDGEQPTGSLDGGKFQTLYERVNRMEIMLEELLELARSEPQHSRPDHIATINERDEPLADNRPKNAFCKHCGNKFAGSRFATICSGCKSQGHTNQPAECPRCTEATSL